MAGLSGVPSYLNPVDVPDAVKLDQSLNSNDNLSREDFFELLITQLQTQDPLEPMDNDRMLDQLATLQGLETNEKLVSGIDTLVSSLSGSALNQGAAILGKIVTGTTKEQLFDADGVPLLTAGGEAIFEDVEVEGLASGISLQDGKTQVTLEVPILDDDGQPIYDPNGFLITKQVTVEGASISGLIDPNIATSQEEDF